MSSQFSTLNLFISALHRNSCGFPVRADSRAASNISITCTFSRAESGSSIGLSLRIQSTKYEIGLLLSFGNASNVKLSPSGGTSGPRVSAKRRCKVLCRASKLPLGPYTAATSFEYGQSHEASITAVASGYSSTIVASSSTLLFCSTFNFRVVAYTREGRPFNQIDHSAP